MKIQRELLPKLPMEVGGIDDLLIDKLRVFLSSSQEDLYIGEGKIESLLWFYVKARKLTAKKKKLIGDM